MSKREHEQTVRVDLGYLLLFCVWYALIAIASLGLPEKTTEFL